jgi:hypothetical protein
VALGHDALFGPPPEQPWVARLLLEPRRLIALDLVPADVGVALEQAAAGVAHVLWADEDQDEWFVRVQPLEATTRDATLALGERLGREVSLGALPGVRSAVVSTARAARLLDPQGLAVATGPHTFVETDGSSLLRALGLPSVVPEQSSSNDVADVCAALGIEAAAAVLFAELELCLRFDSAYLNSRHVLLLVDLMCYLGVLLPISRHGLNRLLHDNGPLARCSFEETLEVLLTAGAYGETDKILGVTEAVCMGQPARVGTGAVTVTGVADGNEAAATEVVFSELVGEHEHGHSTDALGLLMRGGAAAGSVTAVDRPYFDEHDLRAPLRPAGPPEAAAVLPAATGSYAPSSPRSTAPPAKRRYTPSSPRAPR